MNYNLVNKFFVLIFIAVLCACSTRHTEKQQSVLLWFDATANYERFSTPDSIDFYLDKCVAVGVTDIIVDVRPISGELLYKSNIAPFLEEWKGVRRDPDFEFLTHFIEEGHKRKLKVHAALNMFVGGHNHFDRGIVYTEHPEWQTINYTSEGMKPITELKKKYSAMMNPVNPEVQKYLLSILKELVEKYPKLDGIILDRGRFDGIQADFSELSRVTFEAYIGKKIDNFPVDIYEWKTNPEGKPEMVEGQLFKIWLEWRASVIWSFFDKARTVVKSVNPNIIFGDYTGAWYSSYYDVGANWASQQYDPSVDYGWATADYKKYGYAELLDLFTVGCYFTEISIEDVNRMNEENINRTEAGMRATKDPENSVEGSAELALKVTKGVMPLYGGLYVEQYPDREQFAKAIEMCRRKTDGVMIFDIVHIINRGWWDSFQAGINAPVIQEKQEKK